MSLSRTGMPPAMALDCDDEALCTDAAAAIASHRREAAATRAICSAALCAAPPPAALRGHQHVADFVDAGELVDRAHQVALRALLQAAAGDVDVLLLQAL